MDGNPRDHDSRSRFNSSEGYSPPSPRVPRRPPEQVPKWCGRRTLGRRYRGLRGTACRLGSNQQSQLGGRSFRRTSAGTTELVLRRSESSRESRPLAIRRDATHEIRGHDASCSDTGRSIRITLALRAQMATQIAGSAGICPELVPRRSHGEWNIEKAAQQIGRELFERAWGRILEFVPQSLLCVRVSRTSGRVLGRVGGWLALVQGSLEPDHRDANPEVHRRGP